jgi:hypothetical protein
MGWVVCTLVSKAKALYEMSQSLRLENQQANQNFPFLDSNLKIQESQMLGMFCK